MSEAEWDFNSIAAAIARAGDGAQFIKRAVNSHDALVEALANLIRLTELLHSDIPLEQQGHRKALGGYPVLDAARVLLRKCRET